MSVVMFSSCEVCVFFGGRYSIRPCWLTEMINLALVLKKEIKSRPVPFMLKILYKVERPPALSHMDLLYNSLSFTLSHSFHRTPSQLHSHYTSWTF